jgi:hypothetical protein
MYQLRKKGEYSFYMCELTKFDCIGQKKIFIYTKTHIILRQEVYMASSTLNTLSGIAAAAAGFAGEKVSKSGSIPGLDLAAIVPALLGKAGGAGGIMGTIVSAAAKSGVLNSSNLGKLAELAGPLISFSNAKTTGAKKTSAEGIMGLAAAIVGGSGTGANLASIATMASKLAGTAKDNKALTSMASELGKTLSGSFGVSFNGSETAVKALDKVLEGDTKGKLFQAILKGLA